MRKRGANKNQLWTSQGSCRIEDRDEYQGKIARGKPAYDDATEIYGRSAHPSGLRPEDCSLSAHQLDTPGRHGRG